MNLIDTHSHIYLDEFDQDRDKLMEDADKAGITKILMPAIDSSVHDILIKTETSFAKVCVAMMGLHPCSVKANYLQELDIIKEWLGRRKFVAIGETGLDFYWDLSFKTQQYEAFQQQIELAIQYEIPIVLHSRNSTDECIEMIEKNRNEKLRGVFHCFSGSLEQAQKIIELGFYLGIGGVITFKNAGLDKVMEHIGLEQVILETDAPYLAPVPFRGKRNEPSYIHYVAKKLADIKGMSIEEIARITTMNAERVFRC